MIYMDHSATTPVDERVMEVMEPYFGEKYGNASSLHSLGQEANRALEEAREKVAEVIHAEPSEIYFTSGGTESNNFAIKGTAFARKNKGNHIIITEVEHDCVLNACKWLEKRGFEITRLGVDKDGLIDMKELRSSLKEETILVSIMHANNEIGTVQDMEKIGKIVGESNAYLHTDAVQSVTKLPVDVKKMNLNMLSISSHKIFGPKGVGCLYIRKGTTLDPLMHGGGHEHGMRSGTENIAGIVGFGEAIRIEEEERPKVMPRLQRLRDKIIKNVLKMDHTLLNGHPTKRLPINANFTFKFIEGEALVLSLDSKGIAASTGSACSSKSLEASHVLLAIGLKPEEAHGSLRLTLGKGNTEEDVDHLLGALSDVVSELREISPFKTDFEG
ncbi:MAG: cysteine desulfurase NifS [Euryarchaeota archaeon]|nr:cysteine desulfurase NifS [Euryarchaeota archaeon]